MTETCRYVRHGALTLRSCEIRDSASRLRRITIEAFEGDPRVRPLASYAGAFEASRPTEGSTRNVLRVHDVFLPREQWGARLGTRMYELALEAACREGIPLGSSFDRSPFSEAFWRKQVRKGRARCSRTKRGPVHPDAYTGPLSELIDARDTGEITEAEFDRITRKLPKPREGTWKCRRYVTTRALCREPAPSLARLKVRRSSR